MGLKGRVRKLVESDLADNISPSDPKGTAFHVRTIRFSVQGNAISFDNCISTCEKAQFLWQDGFLVETHHQFPNGLPEESVKYVRDAEGRLLETQNYSGDWPQCFWRYAETDLYTEENKFCSGVLANRRVIQRFPASGTVYVSSYEYREEGSPAEETHYEDRSVHLEDGSVRTERVRQNSNYKECWTENAQGQLLEYIGDGTSYNRVTRKYDESGREIERSEWARDGSMINRRTYVYSIDREGNWLRRTEFFSSDAMEQPVPGEVTVREIEYY